MSRKSLIPFLSIKEGQRVPALDHATIHLSSVGLKWKGLSVEVGENQGWEANDLVIEGHYLGLNIAREPLHIERRVGSNFQKCIVDPGRLWLQPAGDPFTIRVSTSAYYAGVVLSPETLTWSTPKALAFEPTFGCNDPVMSHLIHALVAETATGGQSGPLFADGVAASLSATLLSRFGKTQPHYKGGISPKRLRLVADHIRQNINSNLSLDDLASLAGLSPFHFARAFKRSTGKSPHRFVLDVRLEQAKQLILGSKLSLSQVAVQCGFCDQPHLTRLFKQRFGVPPSRLSPGGAIRDRSEQDYSRRSNLPQDL